MKLLYLWVEEYGILEDAEFNFDSNIRFHYDRENKELKKIESKHEIPDNFFSLKEPAGNVVKSVSAIIGNNGAGKTSVFKLLSKILGKTFGPEFILIYLVDQKQTIYSNVDKFKSPTDVLITPFKRELFDRSPDQILFSIFYFSPHYNLYDLSDSSKKWEDISGGYLLYNDYAEYYGEKKTLIKETKNNPDKISAHIFMEVLRTARFFAENRKRIANGTEHFDINVPKGIILSVNENDEKNFVTDEVLIELVNGINKKFVETKSPATNKSLFIEKCVHSALFNFLRTHLNNKIIKYDGKDEADKFIIKPLYKLLQKNRNITFLELIEEYFTLLFPKNSLSHELEHGIYFPNAIEIVRMIVYLKNSVPENCFKESEMLKFDLEKQNELDLFTGFVKIYSETFNKYSYLDMKWSPEISSGEMSYMTMFSRFFKYFDEKQFSKDLHSNILVLLDEVEITLHPELQRKMIKNLISFFNEFALDKKVHLIFATHSPILLSDIPVDNCCFLEREAFKTTVVNEMEQTFGANIHTLFADSFFLKSGTIGDFAKDKINGLINEIKTAEPDDLEENEKSIRNRIEMIGEPIIRGKVISILEERLSTNLIGIYSKVRKIEKRMDNIEKKTE